MTPTQAPIRESFLPVALPMIGEAEIQEVVDTLRSGWVTTGPKVKRFEQQFADYVQARHAIAVSSCTAALHISLTALGVGPGDEVIVPTMTFCATANVVVHLGATPVLVDVDENGHLTAAAAERAITPRTKAIIPVHYSGQACDLDEIVRLAASRGIEVLEDAAHAVGSEYHGRKIGTHSRATCFSFYATKNMTTGEGGMITTDDDSLAALMRVLALHGMSRDAWKRYTEAGSWYYEVVEPGYKNNMTDLQAALGMHQLRALDGFIARRREIAKRYRKAFAGMDEIILPKELGGRSHSYYVFLIRLAPNRLLINRGEFIEALKRENIGASVHFIPLHLHPYYQKTYGYAPEQFPIADELYSGLLSVPLYPKMSDQDVDDVIGAVESIVAEYRTF